MIGKGVMAWSNFLAQVSDGRPSIGCCMTGDKSSLASSARRWYQSTY